MAENFGSLSFTSGLASWFGRGQNVLFVNDHGDETIVQFPPPIQWFFNDELSMDAA